MAADRQLVCDLHRGATNLAFVLDIIRRSERLTAKPIYSDLRSPRRDLLGFAELRLHLAYFYLSLAREWVSV